MISSSRQHYSVDRNQKGVCCHAVGYPGFLYGQQLLDDYPSITKAFNVQAPANHVLTHHIVTAYDGPMEVIHRTGKDATIFLRRCQEVVILDRLQAAFMEPTIFNPPAEAPLINDTGTRPVPALTLTLLKVKKTKSGKQSSSGALKRHL